MVEEVVSDVSGPEALEMSMTVKVLLAILILAGLGCLAFTALLILEGEPAAAGEPAAVAGYLCLAIGALMHVHRKRNV